MRRANGLLLAILMTAALGATGCGTAYEAEAETPAALVAADWCAISDPDPLLTRAHYDALTAGMTMCDIVVMLQRLAVGLDKTEPVTVQRWDGVNALGAPVWIETTLTNGLLSGKRHSAGL
jgi:hypothetical protein